MMRDNGIKKHFPPQEKNRPFRILAALGLIATGFGIRSSRVRMEELAVIVLVSSFLYQKFNMKLRSKKTAQEEASKS